MMISGSFSLNGQTPFQTDLLENVKKGNAIYVYQRDRIIFLEDKLVITNEKLFNVEAAYTECKNEVEEYKVREINYKTQIGYKDQTIKELGKVKNIGYGIAAAVIIYLIAK